MIHPPTSTTVADSSAVATGSPSVGMLPAMVGEAVPPKTAAAVEVANFAAVALVTHPAAATNKFIAFHDSRCVS